MYCILTRSLGCTLFSITSWVAARSISQWAWTSPAAMETPPTHPHFTTLTQLSRTSISKHYWPSGPYVKTTIRKQCGSSLLSLPPPASFLSLLRWQWFSICGAIFHYRDKLFPALGFGGKVGGTVNVYFCCAVCYHMISAITGFSWVCTEWQPPESLLFWHRWSDRGVSECTEKCATLWTNLCCTDHQPCGKVCWAGCTTTQCTGTLGSWFWTSDPKLAPHKIVHPLHCVATIVSRQSNIIWTWAMTTTRQ